MLTTPRTTLASRLPSITRCIHPRLVAGLVALAAPAACDGAGEATGATHDVSLGAVVSDFASCSSLTASSLDFEVANVGASPVTLVSIEVSSATTHALKFFVAGATLPAGAARAFACEGGFSSAAGTPSGQERSTATLRYVVDGVERSVEATGQHTIGLLFDNCDTGLPQRPATDCAPVE